MIRIQPIRQAKKRGDGLQNRGTGRSPGSPVEHGGVGELHAAFLTESRTRSPWMEPRTGNSGPFEASLNGVPCPVLCSVPTMLNSMKTVHPGWCTFPPGKI